MDELAGLHVETSVEERAVAKTLVCVDLDDPDSKRGREGEREGGREGG